MSGRWRVSHQIRVVIAWTVVVGAALVTTVACTWGMLATSEPSDVVHEALTIAKDRDRDALVASRVSELVRAADVARVEACNRCAAFVDRAEQLIAQAPADGSSWAWDEQVRALDNPLRSERASFLFRVAGLGAVVTGFTLMIGAAVSTAAPPGTVVPRTRSVGQPDILP